MAAAMREHQVVGSAQVDMFVPEDGIPQDLRIDDTAVPDLVRREALRIASAIRFEAAHIDGFPVAVWSRIPITFMPLRE